MKTSRLSQFSGSRGRYPPRSSSKTRLPDDASACASVPPPAPVPMMMTSYWFDEDILLLRAVAAVEDAAAMGVMVDLRAVDVTRPSAARVDFCSEKHSDDGSCKIHPESRKDASG